MNVDVFYILEEICATLKRVIATLEWQMLEIRYCSSSVIDIEAYLLKFIYAIDAENKSCTSYDWPLNERVSPLRHLYSPA